MAADCHSVRDKEIGLWPWRKRGHSVFATMTTPGQAVDANTLSFEELRALHQQLDEELSFMARSFDQLAGIASRFSDSKASLESMKKAKAGAFVFQYLLSHVRRE